MEKKKTTIAITEENKEKLDQLGKKGETYDGILGKLLVDAFKEYIDEHAVKSPYKKKPKKEDNKK